MKVQVPEIKDTQLQDDEAMARRLQAEMDGGSGGSGGGFQHVAPKRTVRDSATGGKHFRLRLLLLPHIFVAFNKLKNNFHFYETLSPHCLSFFILQHHVFLFPRISFLRLSVSFLFSPFAACVEPSPLLTRAFFLFSILPTNPPPE